MYLTSGTNITHIKTIEVDEENRLTNANKKELRYTSSVTNGNQFKDENGVVYTVSSSSVLIFVPNGRTDYGDKGYAMGKPSALSSKLVNNHYYYVEPYYRESTGSDGSVSNTRDLYVVYYEEIDKEPRYYNDNVVVKELKLDASTQQYKLTVLSGTQGSGGTSFNVHCASGANINDSIMAYVLDENFERMTDGDGNYVKRRVEAGDVIRFGKLPDGQILNIEIIFDISEDIAARKHAIYRPDRKLGLEDLEWNEDSVQLFAQVGLIKSDFDETASDITLSLILGDNASANGTLYTQNSAKVYAYDFGIEETNKFSSEIKTVSDINMMTDMVYVNQIHKSAGLTTSYIYVVRYNEDVQEKYRNYKESLETP